MDRSVCTSDRAVDVGDQETIAADRLLIPPVVRAIASDRLPIVRGRARYTRQHAVRALDVAAIGEVRAKGPADGRELMADGTPREPELRTEGVTSETGAHAVKEREGELRQLAAEDELIEEVDEAVIDVGRSVARVGRLGGDDVGILTRADVMCSACLPPPGLVDGVMPCDLAGEAQPSAKIVRCG